MPVDSSIALNVQPVQLPDFASLAVKRANVMNYMSEMAARQRAADEQNAMQGMLNMPGFNMDSPESQQLLMRTAPNLAPGFLKNLSESKAAAIKAQEDERVAKFNQQQQSLQRVYGFSSFADAKADLKRTLDAGEIDQNQYDSFLSTMSDDETKFDSWLTNFTRKVLGMGDTKAVLETESRAVDAGGRILSQTKSKYGDGGWTTDETIKKDFSPSEAAAAETARLNAGKLNFTSPDGAGVIYGLNPQTGAVVSRVQTTPDPSKKDKTSENATGFAARGEAAKSVLETIGTLIGETPWAKGADSGEGILQAGEAGLSGQLMSNVGGTTAKDVAAALVSIKANLGFDRLQQMREESKTGGALGQVAVQELEALQATLASLDQAQKPETLRDNLRRVREHYQRWLDTMAKIDAQKAQSPASAPASGSTRGVVNWDDL